MYMQWYFGVILGSPKGCSHGNSCTSELYEGASEFDEGGDKFVLDSPHRAAGNSGCTSLLVPGPSLVRRKLREITSIYEPPRRIP